jgi:protein-tyrosine phosphatase
VLSGRRLEPGSSRPIERMHEPLQRILFICTGNYYRSRFAELLFNALAEARCLAWRADSRGTDVENAGRWNVGPLSVFARQALAERGVVVDAAPRMPRQLAENDLAKADLIIAICEREHRAQLDLLFPDWSGRIKYWSIEDLHTEPAECALVALHEHVDDLLARLAACIPD